jgi:hypothetical protein
LLRAARQTLYCGRGRNLFTSPRHSDVYSLQFGFQLPNASTVQLHQDSDCVFATRLQVEFVQSSQWQGRRYAIIVIWTSASTAGRCR